MTYYYNGSTTASISDAADILSETTFDSNNTSYSLYSYDGELAESDTIGIRFTNVTIPKSDPIYWAKLRIWTSGDGGNCIVYAVAADNEGVFSSTNRPKNQTVTTAHTHVALGSGTEIITEIDVRAIVQEIVNRAGWASGNAISFIIKDQSIDDVKSTGYHTYDGEYYSSLTILSGVERTAPDSGGRVQINIGDVWKTAGTMYVNNDSGISEFNYTMADYEWGTGSFYPSQTAQTFTIGTNGPNQNFTINDVRVRLDTSYGDGGVYDVYIKATSGGTPTGNALSSGTLDKDVNATIDMGAYTFFIVPMSAYVLQASTQYALILAPRVGTDVDNFYSWYGQNYNTYSGGSGWEWNGSTWSNYGVDFMFEIWGTGSWKPIVGMKVNIGDVWKTIF